MGYRSQVAIAISKEEYVQDSLLLHTVPKWLKEEPPAQVSDSVYWRFSGVKWYDSYPEVAEVMSYLSKKEAQNYGFVRTGEDIGDIEEEGEPWEFDLYATQGIETPLGDL